MYSDTVIPAAYTVVNSRVLSCACHMLRVVRIGASPKKFIMRSKGRTARSPGEQKIMAVEQVFS